jgi:hypothetical protein
VLEDHERHRVIAAKAQESWIAKVADNLAVIARKSWEKAWA